MFHETQRINLTDLKGHHINTYTQCLSFSFMVLLIHAIIYVMLSYIIAKKVDRVINSKVDSLR